MRKTKISCIVPCYNHGRFLRERLDSILGQTRLPDEVVLLDDASTDNSREILQEYADRFPDLIACHFNTVNSGCPFVQWKKGVGLARGEYIWIAESDDVAHPHFLAKLASMLEKNREVGVAYCQSQKVNEAGESLGDMQFLTDALDPVRWRSSFQNNGPDECVNFLIKKNTIPNASAVVFRKSAYEAVDDTPLGFRLCGDWLVWVSMLKEFDLAYTPELLNCFRHHERSVREKSKMETYLSEVWRIEQFILRNFDVPDESRDDLLARKLHMIDESMPILERGLQAPRVVKQYKSGVRDLFEDLNEEERKGWFGGINVFGPLAARLADYGNKSVQNRDYKCARKFYWESLRHNKYSFRVYIYFALTCIPGLSEIFRKS